MKKLVNILVVMIICVIICGSGKVNAATVTLSQVVDAFNNSSTVSQYKEYDYNWVAKASDNKLTIDASNPEDSTTIEYTLDDSILSTTISSGDSLTGLFVTLVLTDSIGQIHGYEDGTLFETLNSDHISNYTVENEGFELKSLSNGDYDIKIDIDKKLPLADTSEDFIEVSDLEGFTRDILVSDEPGSINGIAGALSYYVSTDSDGITTIYVGEKNGTTMRTYNSILSMIEVMFDASDASDYFEENYPSMTEGNKNFGGFDVEMNASPDDISTFSEEDQITKVTVDREFVKNNILNEEIDNIQEDEDVEEYESIDENKNIVIYVCIGIALIVVILGIVIFLKKKGK